jgi:hypothetical protein
MAIRFLKSAWSEVTVSCISNCFRKAGFEDRDLESVTDENNEFDEDDEIPLALLTQRFNSSFDDIVRVDENVVAVETRSEDDIVQEILGKTNAESNDSGAESDDDIDDEYIDPTDEPNLEDSMNSIQILRRYLESSENVPDALFTQLCEIEKFINVSKTKQSTLHNYFKTV